jgi:hypothetical protein
VRSLGEVDGAEGVDGRTAMGRQMTAAGPGAAPESADDPGGDAEGDGDEPGAPAEPVALTVAFVLALAPAVAVAVAVAELEDVAPPDGPVGVAESEGSGRSVPVVRQGGEGGGTV